MKELEMRFHKSMIGIYESAKIECKYTASRFIQMVSEEGGLLTARKLIARNEPTDGFVALWECGRLDLTVEAFSLKPEFAELFTDEEKERARSRLKEYGYNFD